MTYVAGAILFLLGGLFFMSGFTHRRKSLAEEARRKHENPDAKPVEMHPSLSMLVDFAPFLTVVSLLILTAMITVTFFAVNALRWFSLFDLAGVYAMIAGYGYWMSMKTKHRSVETQRALSA